MSTVVNDQCKHCTCRGDMAACLSTACSVRESWFVRAILAKPSAPTDTRSTFSGAADYDQTTPFNGIDGASE